MHSGHDVIISGEQAFQPEVRKPDWPVQTTEFQDKASGLYFRSFMPDEATAPTWARLVLLHGYGDHGGRYGHVLDWLAARGISCSTMDFRGHGRSLGRRGFVWKWEEFLDDVDTFLAWERCRSSRNNDDRPPLPLFVLGHSHGGLVAAAAGIAGRLKSDGNVACILASPYLRSMRPLSGPWSAVAWALNHMLPWIQVKSGLSPKMMTSDAAMQAAAVSDPLLGHGATPRWYEETLRVQARVRHDAGKFRLPLLCLIGDADPIADPAAADEFVRDAGAADKALYRYPGDLHELLRERDRETIFQAIYDWMSARAERLSRQPTV